jgi:hypothetical protein
MGLFNKLGIGSDITPAIDWELIPAETFAIFESWGGRERVKSSKERFYYFFIDNWETPPTLCLMERGIKHARVLAKINAPQELIDNAVAVQGKTMGLDRSYAIDEPLKQWLLENVVDTSDDSRVLPLPYGLEEQVADYSLPKKTDSLPGIETVNLTYDKTSIEENDVPGLVKKHNFFDSQYNPQGKFANYLVDNNDGLTVTDKVTGLMWLREGYDLTSIRKMLGHVKDANDKSIAGFSDWRLPTMEEALSLMETKPNVYDLHLHPCFSGKEPFIFLHEKREPGGYWFCDYKQGTVFWASGTIPGGFGRLCRKAE